jgi:hypothetical protein
MLRSYISVNSSNCEIVQRRHLFGNFRLGLQDMPSIGSRGRVWWRWVVNTWSWFGLGREDRRQMDLFIMNHGRLMAGRADEGK